MYINTSDHKHKLICKHTLTSKHIDKDIYSHKYKYFFSCALEFLKLFKDVKLKKNNALSKRRNLYHGICFSAYASANNKIFHHSLSSTFQVVQGKLCRQPGQRVALTVNNQTFWSP